MTLIGEGLHQNRIAIMRAATDALSRYGNGYNVTIDCSYLVVSVEFEWFNGHHRKASGFNLDAQQGSADTCYDMALGRSVAALKDLGAEITTIEDFLRKN